MTGFLNKIFPISKVEVILNVTYVEVMRLYFHERNDSNILSNSDDSGGGNFIIKSYGGYVTN